ncbi:unnamed protein product [Durusdinium trenchii]|uniref:Alpha-tubulin N-acetyltransferase n=1 Tax=Durusdinium trenchii TaxID=1381693 RepID=A0ABP0JY80_9DINO
MVSTDGEGPYVSIVDNAALQADVGGALSSLLEDLGKSSANAQGLRKPVTSGICLGDQRVYLLLDGRTALGFLKVGRKRLFVEAPFAASDWADVRNAFQEIQPLCALDFYIHERYQRSGFGRQLFDAMLAHERSSPELLGYDRPSPKLLSFLSKHYGLRKYKPQNNNFVVYDDFWSQAERADPRADGRAADLRTCRQSAGDRARPARPKGQKDLFSRPVEHPRQGQRLPPIF